MVVCAKEFQDDAQNFGNTKHGNSFTLMHPVSLHRLLVNIDLKQKEINTDLNVIRFFIKRWLKIT